MKHTLLLALCLLFLSSTTLAQFTGPSASGEASTVEQARQARIGTYVTLTGNIVAQQREDYYRFRDQTGEIRVEIETPVWRNRKIGPDTKVRLVAEVDRNAAGTRYLWVESLELVE
ncbi:MAG: hypothetical protein C1943_05650 [Halochromatium sp.]|nr:hypothetical protein [Halochromatium sp.]